MLRPNVEQALNDQINHEFSAAYLYLSMSAHFDAQGYSGFAKWMRLQSQEEVAHGMKLFDFLLARGGKVDLQAIEKPPAKFGTPLEVFTKAHGHEVEVTGLINKLYATAMKENDFVTTAELQWFLTEQVEEEKTAADIVQRLQIASGDANALLLLDRELGSRTSAA